MLKVGQLPSGAYRQGITWRASVLPVASYMSMRWRAAEERASMVGLSEMPSAASWRPSAASPAANCATLVRSRQSMQLVRSTPCCTTWMVAGHVKLCND